MAGSVVRRNTKMIATKVNALMKKVNQHQWTAESISSLDDMQNLVGGYVERLSLPHNILLWVNEEAALTKLELNLMLIWDDHPRFHQPIFGPVFLTSVDNHGEMTSLTDKQKQWLAHHLVHVRLANGQNLIAIDLRERCEFK